MQRQILASLLLSIAGAPALALPPAEGPVQATDLDAAVREPAAIVDSFHAALKRGNVQAALSHLHDDAIVYETGGAERGKAEYAAHHAASDAAFAKSVQSQVVRRAGRAVGDTAWILTEGRTKGTFKQRPIDTKTVETMILQRTEGAWRIVHIHWSSGAVRPAA